MVMTTMIEQETPHPSLTARAAALDSRLRSFFFFVSTEMTGCQAAWRSITFALICSS
jgi:hypothetical protein